MKIRPTFTIIAGANGAGKSTYTKITGQNNFDVDKEFYKVKYRNPFFSEQKIQNEVDKKFNKGIESIKKQLKSFDFIQFVDSDNNEFRKISELNLRTKELKNSTKAKLPKWYKQNFEPLVNSIKITQKRGPKL